MKENIIFVLKSTVMIFILSSCTLNKSPEATKMSSTSKQGQGNLSLVVNGEDFIRQGFVSKDGWQIEFNHAYITLDEVIAYQSNPPFNPGNEEKLQVTKSITLVDRPTTIDLAQGDEKALPIKVTEVSAPIGHYNAIAWNLVNNPEDNTSIVLDGVATKNEQIINFVLKFSLNLSYLCGEFVGDERKGIVEANKTAELETTFHFDHLFGDREIMPDDDLNAGALGFKPLAMIATSGKLNADLNTLEKQLSVEDYSKLMDNLQSLGHVGEGHCILTR